ncbi:MAG: hypothetical protein GYA17_04740 [Chloroflexi bacterium]|nr:hypothetical protein [Anaerolineaceae bacterium]NMB87640.1 hypothetical protein [Chloroflexota bacterium]
MNLDIHTAVQTALLLSVLGTLLCAWIGVRTIQAGQKLMYFRKRRELMVRGWRLIFTSVVLVAASFFMFRYAEPTVYRFYVPSSTVTLTPTVTQTGTITMTPTISATPTETEIPLISPTPQLPPEVLAQFTSEVTPNADSAFSSVVMAKEIDDDFQPVEPASEYNNPVGKLYGAFSYDQMASGAQWTAMWIRMEDQRILCLETIPWDGSTGGYGYTECEPSSDDWLPGTYQVQIYVGETWKAFGEFTVVGEPPTPTSSPSPTRTLTSTPAPTNTRTPAPTATASVTPGPTIPPTATQTRTPTRTATITLTPTITRTPPPTSTRWPTRTPRMTDTRWPSQTPVLP